MIFPSKLLQK